MSLTGARATDPPSKPRPILRVTRALLAGFLLRCPVCWRGSLFPGPLGYAMRERCPSCDVEFMPDRGEITGGMAITMVLTSILGIAGVIYLAVFTTLSPVWAVALLVAIPALFALWFHRHAHGLWVAALYLTRSMGEPHPLAQSRPGRQGRQGRQRPSARPAR